MKNKFVAMAAFSGFFCIAFGAFATHGLEKMLEPKALVWIETGLKYQMFHTLALMALGLFQIANSSDKTHCVLSVADGNDPEGANKRENRAYEYNPPACRAKAFNIIGGAWFVGILLFSGSLYALALDIGRIPMLTPIGGLSFMLGWAVLAYISVRSRKNVQ